MSAHLLAAADSTATPGNAGPMVSADGKGGGRRHTRFGSIRRSAQSNRQTLVRPRRSVVTEHVRGCFFGEARPVPGVTYFPASPASTAVVICLYNEVGPEIDRTICSLASSGVMLNVVLVADGLAKLSESAKGYLIRTFKLESCTSVLEADSYSWSGPQQTFVSDPVVIGGGGSTFCLLLKRFNHKKINSHEWFFRAHCPNSGCQYALTTDTGAVFRPGAVLKLICFLEANENYVAVTGRQRVMSEFNQRVKGRAAKGEVHRLDARGWSTRVRPSYPAPWPRAPPCDRNTCRRSRGTRSSRSACVCCRALTLKSTTRVARLRAASPGCCRACTARAPSSASA